MKHFNPFWVILMLPFAFYECKSKGPRINLSAKEEAYSKTASTLFQYLHISTQIDTSQKNKIIKSFIYLGRVYDSDKSKIVFQGKYVDFYEWFKYIKTEIDSVGLTNIEIVPVRFYKNPHILDPMDEDLQSRILLYYDKQFPERPLGTLLFDSSTNKISTWLFIDSLPKYYFLRYNLIE